MSPGKKRLMGIHNESNEMRTGQTAKSKHLLSKKKTTQALTAVLIGSACALSAVQAAQITRSGVDLRIIGELSGVQTDIRSNPAVADLDGDGLGDVLVGDRTGTLRYFQPLDGSVDPDFVERTGVDNPFAGIDVGNNSSPAFVDLDGDGDMDLAVGARSGEVFYFENTGSTTNPIYEPRTGGDNVLAVASVDEAPSAPSPEERQDAFLSPTFGDLDGDGDLDLLVTNRAGDFRYFENIGDSANPVYEERTGDANPFANAAISPFSVVVQTAPDAFSHVALADLDDDGDLDAIIGVEAGTLRYLENTGDASNPEFTDRIEKNPFKGITTGGFASPSAGDFDRDGDDDLLIGGVSGDVLYIRNDNIDGDNGGPDDGDFGGRGGGGAFGPFSLIALLPLLYARRTRKYKA